MTNGKNINNMAEFETHIREMQDRELMEFTARCVYQQSENFSACQKDCKGRLLSLEESNYRNARLGGGIGGGIGAAIIGAIYVIWYFLKNG